MNIKYAHKWDTPATLGCSVSNITFSERSVYVESKWCCCVFYHHV